MRATKSKETIAAKRKKKPAAELTIEEQRQLQEHAHQTQERRAETQLNLAKLFLAKDKPEIALRRLKELIAEFPETTVAKAARRLVKSLS